MKSILVLLAILVSGLAGWYGWWLVRMERIESLQERFSQYDEIADPDTYVKAVMEEERKQLRFPLHQPAYAIVEYNTPWRLSHTLRYEETEEIRSILSDSANYLWGELGTPFSYALIVFYDSTDVPVGLSKVNYQGAIYSYPHIPRMKWGTIGTTEGMNRVIALIDPR